MKENGLLQPGWKEEGNGVRSLELLNADTNRINTLIQQYTDSVLRGQIEIP
jgi:hypothetical protein